MANVCQCLTVSRQSNKMSFKLTKEFCMQVPSCFYRASICQGGLGSRNFVRPSVRRSVRLSVCLSQAWIVTKLNDALQIFLYLTKGQSLCDSDTKSGWSATPPSL